MLLRFAMDRIVHGISNCRHQRAYEATMDQRVSAPTTPVNHRRNVSWCSRRCRSGPCDCRSYEEQLWWQLDRPCRRSVRIASDGRTTFRVSHSGWRSIRCPKLAQGLEFICNVGMAVARNKSCVQHFHLENWRLSSAFGLMFGTTSSAPNVEAPNVHMKYSLLHRCIHRLRIFWDISNGGILIARPRASWC